MIKILGFFYEKTRVSMSVYKNQGQGSNWLESLLSPIHTLLLHGFPFSYIGVMILRPKISLHGRTGSPKNRLLRDFCMYLVVSVVSSCIPAISVILLHSGRFRNFVITAITINSGHGPLAQHNDHGYGPAPATLRPRSRSRFPQHNGHDHETVTQLLT